MIQKNFSWKIIIIQFVNLFKRLLHNFKVPEIFRQCIPMNWRVNYRKHTPALISGWKSSGLGYKALDRLAKSVTTKSLKVSKMRIIILTPHRIVVGTECMLKCSINCHGCRGSGPLCSTMNTIMEVGDVRSGFHSADEKSHSLTRSPWPLVSSSIRWGDWTLWVP